MQNIEIKRNLTLTLRTMILTLILLFSATIYTFILKSQIIGFLYFMLTLYGIIKCFWALKHPYIIIRDNTLTVYSDIILPRKSIVLSDVYKTTIERRKIIIQSNKRKIIISFNKVNKFERDKLSEIITSINQNIGKN